MLVEVFTELFEHEHIVLSKFEVVEKVDD